MKLSCEGCELMCEAELSSFVQSYIVSQGTSLIIPINACYYLEVHGGVTIQ